MGFFSREDGKKEEAAKKAESERLTGKLAKPVEAAAPKRTASLKTFVIGFRPNEKLSGVPLDRFDEGLKALLPKGTRVVPVNAPGVLGGRDAGIRFFEIGLSGQDMGEALATILDRGLLDGQIQVAFDQCVVVCDAAGKSAQLSMIGETISGSGMRYTIRTESPEVYVQYPPLDVHKRWLADDDYRAAYGRWRTERLDEAKPPRWHAGWMAPAGDDSPPWIKLKSRDGKPDEYILDFEDSMLLSFAFQGAVIRIERFNMKVAVSRITGEQAVYRSLPLSYKSIPKEVQDRMNREPERFKPLREAGKFGMSFDLVRVAYEELAGDYFSLELPAGAGASTSAASEPVSLQSGPIARPEPEPPKKAGLPPPRLGTPLVSPTSGTFRASKLTEQPKPPEKTPES